MRSTRRSRHEQRVEGKQHDAVANMAPPASSIAGAERRLEIPLEPVRRSCTATRTPKASNR